MGNFLLGCLGGGVFFFKNLGWGGVLGDLAIFGHFWPFRLKCIRPKRAKIVQAGVGGPRDEILTNGHSGVSVVEEFFLKIFFGVF